MVGRTGVYYCCQLMAADNVAQRFRNGTGVGSLS